MKVRLRALLKTLIFDRFSSMEGRMKKKRFLKDFFLLQNDFFSKYRIGRIYVKRTQNLGLCRITNISTKEMRRESVQKSKKMQFYR